jgi:hypothetical protein
MTDIRTILSAMGVMQRNLLEPELEQCEVTSWHEYRAHGGKLDFTAWQEKGQSYDKRHER